MTSNERNDAIAAIRSNLKNRSGRTWSVRGGVGSSWGWITITAPPARLERGSMSDEDRELLSALLGETVHSQGTLVPASSDYRAEYVDRSAGRTPSTIGRPYWD